MPRPSFELAVSDFTQAIGLLIRRVRSTAPASELSFTETAVLKSIAQHGPATTADLARTHGMRPQSMRPIIATLDHYGMLARKPHPTDGRQVILELTAKGSATRKSAQDAKNSWIAHSIAQLDEHERETLFNAGKILRRIVEGDTP